MEDLFKTYGGTILAIVGSLILISIIIGIFSSTGNFWDVKREATYYEEDADGHSGVVEEKQKSKKDGLSLLQFGDIIGGSL